MGCTTLPGYARYKVVELSAKCARTEIRYGKQVEQEKVRLHCLITLGSTGAEGQQALSMILSISIPMCGLVEALVNFQNESEYEIRSP